MCAFVEECMRCVCICGRREKERESGVGKRGREKEGEIDEIDDIDNRWMDR